MSPIDQLARLIERFAVADGVTHTALPRVRLTRASRPLSKTHTVHTAAFCLIAQGAKHITLADETYVYDPSSYLLSTIDVPVSSQIRDVSPEKPMLGFILDLDPHELAALVLQSGAPAPGVGPRRGLFVATVDQPLIEAVVRLVKLLETPQDIPALGQLAEREVLYRLLRGEQGARVSEVAIAHSHAQRIGRPIQW